MSTSHFIGKSLGQPSDSKEQALDFFKKEKKALTEAAGKNLQWDDTALLPTWIISSSQLTEDEAKNYANQIQAALKLPADAAGSVKSKHTTSNVDPGYRVFIAIRALGEALKLTPDINLIHTIQKRTPPETHKMATYRYSEDKQSVFGIVSSSAPYNLVAIKILTEKEGPHNYNGFGARFIHTAENKNNCWAVKINLEILKKYTPKTPPASPAPRVEPPQPTATAAALQTPTGETTQTSPSKRN